MNEDNNYSDRNILREGILRDANIEQRIIHQARKLAEKLNIEIEKGNDDTAFMIALLLAAFKDFLDIVLDFLLIGLIPGVSFAIGLFLTSFLFFFMLGKGWFLKWKIKFWFWFLGLFIDGLPLFNALPINVLLVLYAWRLTKKRAEKGKLKLKDLSNLTEKEINELNNDISLLETVAVNTSRRTPQRNAGDRLKYSPNDTGRGRVPLQSPRFNLAKNPGQNVETKNTPQMSSLLDSKIDLSKKRQGDENSKETEKEQRTKNVLSELNTFLQDPRLAGLSESGVEEKIKNSEVNDPDLFKAHQRLEQKFSDVDFHDKKTVLLALKTVANEDFRDNIASEYIYKNVNDDNLHASREELHSMIDSHNLFKDPDKRKKVVRDFDVYIAKKNGENEIIDESGKKIQLVSGLGQHPTNNMSFDTMNQPGDKIIQNGEEKIIRASEYSIGANLNLGVKDKEYKYTSPKNPSVQVGVIYDKDTKKFGKMNFTSDSPILAGKAILDMAERIPVGSNLFEGDESMSADSFPLLLNSITRFERKSPGRFTAEQVGEFYLNLQGMSSTISKAKTLEEKVELLNKAIDDFSIGSKTPISHARIEGSGITQKIILPKIKVVKNF